MPITISTDSSGWRCCCGCFQLTDDFCRDLNYYPYLTKHWKIIYPVIDPGNIEDAPPYWPWWIDTQGCPDFPGHLVEDGNAGAMIVMTNKMRAGPNNTDDVFTHYMNVGVTVTSEEVEDTYTLMVDWHETCGGYAFYGLRYTRVDADTATLELFKSEDNVETALADCTITVSANGLPPVGTQFAMGLCITKGSLIGSASTGTIVYLFGSGNLGSGESDEFSVPPGPNSQCTLPTGWYAGLTHGNSHEVRFQLWSYTQLDDDYSECPQCGVCICDRSEIDEDDVSTVPPKLLLTFSNVSDDCPGLDGKALIIAAEQCNPTRWAATLGGDCIPCLKPIEVQSIGAGASLTFNFVLDCGGSLCDPNDPAQEPYYLDSFILNMSYSQSGNILVTEKSIACPSHPWCIQMTDGYRCEDWSMAFEVDPEIVPCPDPIYYCTNGPSRITLNVAESTCKPLMLVFDYDGYETITFPAVELLTDPGIEGCSGFGRSGCNADDEPCCWPCTFNPSVAIPPEEPGMPPTFIPATRVCHVAFRITVTECPEGLENPCDDAVYPGI